MGFLTGPPLNLSYAFSTTCNETHLPVILSWLLPHLDAEVLVLSYTLVSSAADEVPNVMMLAYNSTDATVFLQYNETYDITLYATSCGGGLKSDTISINLTLPKYEGMCLQRGKTALAPVFTLRCACAARGQVIALRLDCIYLQKYFFETQKYSLSEDRKVSLRI